jgi:hypothetical protein
MVDASAGLRRHHTVPTTVEAELQDDVAAFYEGWKPRAPEDGYAPGHIDGPPLPNYAATIVPNWKAPPSYLSTLPLKTVSDARLNVPLLASWGTCSELRWLGADYLATIDWSVLSKAQQKSSPALTAPGSPFVEQLLKFRWARPAPKGVQTFSSVGFPVLKANGSHTRWVVDCIVNRASSAPTKTTFPRIENVHDHWLFFSGGREDDAVSWYGQFPLGDALQRLFALAAGSLVLMMTVMVQGWSPATRVAEQTLNAIYDRAYGARPDVAHHYSGYVDNALTLSNDEAADAILLHEVRCVHQSVGADFVYDSWSRSVSFTGYVLTTLDHGTKCITLKHSWASRALPFLETVASAGSVSLDTKAQAVGVALWICRVLRHSLAEVYDVIHWTRDRDDCLLDAPIRRDIERVCTWLCAPRLLPRLSDLRHITIAASDATPSSIAAVVWSPCKMQLQDAYRPRCLNPLIVYAYDHFHATKDLLTLASVNAVTLPWRRSINDTELLAVLLAVLTTPPSGILLLAIDSTVAKAWARRGLARQRAAARVVRRIALVCRAKCIRLMLVHVKSELNPADKYTRAEAGCRGVVTDASIALVPLTDPADIQVTSWV